MRQKDNERFVGKLFGTTRAPLSIEATNKHRHYRSLYPARRQLRAEGKRLAAAEQLTHEEVRGNRTREQDRKMIMITE
jgi:hypothetical protein